MRAAAPQFIERGDSVSRYLQAEVLNHRKLLHHHVVEFKEVLLTPSHLGIVMEYVPGRAGGSLWDELSSLRRLFHAPGACRRWLRTSFGSA
jgi:serine/threonine-protein kinase SRK2